MIDICLVLEGTYPYVAGGVSSWIHQLIQSMRNIRFSIINISPFNDPRREIKYDIPPHVVDIKDIFLHEYDMSGTLSSKSNRDSLLTRFMETHEKLLSRQHGAFKDLLPLFQDGSGQNLSMRDIFDSKEAWAYLLAEYKKHGENVSFIDFFWTWRSIYLPLYQIIKNPLPKARLYHSVSTGYAGLVASIAKNIHQKNMLLTEHGIYTHERLLEISQAGWIYSQAHDRFRVETEMSFFKKFWLNLFQIMGGITYHNADQILTLYEGNRQKQISDGADPQKISVVPNGIKIQKYKNIQTHRLNPDAPQIAFIGRVVPIKDVKTFIHAVKLVSNKIPRAQFHILGPMDEEPEYAAECINLRDYLNLNDKLQFKGRVNLQEYLSNLDLVVLTSVSEAQPLVILEANAVGIPVVATNVGACREMLEGRDQEDRDLGNSGIITTVSDPKGTAGAILRIVGDPNRWEKMSRAGKKRTERFYDETDLISQYLNIYEKNMR